MQAVCVTEIYKHAVCVDSLQTLCTVTEYSGAGRDFRSSVFQLPTQCRDPQRIIILRGLNPKVW